MDQQSGYDVTITVRSIRHHPKSSDAYFTIGWTREMAQRTERATFKALIDARFAQAIEANAEKIGGHSTISLYEITYREPDFDTILVFPPTDLRRNIAELWDVILLRQTQWEARSAQAKERGDG